MRGGGRWADRSELLHHGRRGSVGTGSKLAPFMVLQPQIGRHSKVTVY